jgi:ArsR family transcriptional regulator, arsenate/arsenite/antimonite-responsive transcriptional repressor / arsenate reductase (thioredoxin)
LSDTVLAVTTDDRSPRLSIRALRHAALGDPVRLAIVDEVTVSDRAPCELQEFLGISSSLLAHHLEVLEQVGLVARHRSAGDGRRRYVRLAEEALEGLVPRRLVAAGGVLFVCTRNSARSPMAAALWQRATGQPALSAGTDPAERVHPKAVASGRRRGLDVGAVLPRHLDAVTEAHELVVTVCDRAHEELARRGWLHWSITDPVEVGSAAAFDAARDELQRRIETLAGAAWSDDGAG